MVIRVSFANPFATQRLVRDFLLIKETIVGFEYTIKNLLVPPETFLLLKTVSYAYYG